MMPEAFETLHSIIAKTPYFYSTRLDYGAGGMRNLGGNGNGEPIEAFHDGAISHEGVGMGDGDLYGDGESSANQSNPY